MAKWNLVEFEAFRELDERTMTWGPVRFDIRHYDWVDDRERFWRWQSRRARGWRMVRRAAARITESRKGA